MCTTSDISFVHEKIKIITEKLSQDPFVSDTQREIVTLRQKLHFLLPVLPISSSSAAFSSLTNEDFLI